MGISRAIRLQAGMAILFAVSCASATAADRRPAVLQWDGVDGALVGTAEVQPDGSAQLAFQSAKPPRSCSGAMLLGVEGTNGTWALSCVDGTTASGRYTSNGKGEGGFGTGSAIGGRRVTFSVGPAVNPPPPAVTAESRKPAAPEPTVTALLPSSKTGRQPTADELNEAEAAKTRSRPAAPVAAPRVAAATTITVEDLDRVRAMYAPCWNRPPSDHPGLANHIVEIEMFANPNGTIGKVLARPKTRLDSDPYYQFTRDAALRAVINPRCIGINGRMLPLPRESYDQWRSFVLVFDPMASEPKPNDDSATRALLDTNPLASCPPSGSDSIFNPVAGLGAAFCGWFALATYQGKLNTAYQSGPAAQTEFHSRCAARLREQPDLAGDSEAKLLERCREIGPRLMLLHKFGAYPTTAERTAQIDKCLDSGKVSGAYKFGRDSENRERCAAQVAATEKAARDPQNNPFLKQQPPRSAGTSTESAHELLKKLLTPK